MLKDNTVENIKNKLKLLGIDVSRCGPDTVKLTEANTRRSIIYNGIKVKYDGDKTRVSKYILGINFWILSIIIVVFTFYGIHSSFSLDPVTGISLYVTYAIQIPILWIVGFLYFSIVQVQIEITAIQTTAIPVVAKCIEEQIASGG